MRRRDVLVLLGGTTAAWPVLGHAQKAQRRPRIVHIGILNYAGSRYARVAAPSITSSARLIQPSTYSDWSLWEGSGSILSVMRIKSVDAI
ncbi:hypothetical protein BB934_37315 (plasmid) [Microvirga ossetica]|uniref:Uncharacterized protein n=1 Tax=Microvirga ossetica TaxID=1882682 RepID=A0A1B2EV80_9HYPH|nr:hypothetical protein BB934_37315 [Microvirga ossetica]